MVAFNFNANEVAPDTGGSGSLPASPPDGLKVVITGSEKVPTQTNPNNHMLNLELQVVEGEHTGRTGMMRLCIWHDKEETARIAASKLSAVAWCVGQPIFQDTSQLHNKPFIVHTIITDPEKGYSEVKKVCDVNGNIAKSGGGAAPQNGPNMSQFSPQMATSGANVAQNPQVETVPFDQSQQQVPQGDPNKPIWGQG